MNVSILKPVAQLFRQPAAYLPVTLVVSAVNLVGAGRPCEVTYNVRRELRQLERDKAEEGLRD